jgi:hypothetical protein
MSRSIDYDPLPHIVASSGMLTCMICAKSIRVDPDWSDAAYDWLVEHRGCLDG